MKKFKDTKQAKKIKVLREKYRAEVKKIKKKLFSAVKKYKEDMEIERMAVAKKRTKRLS